jgi:dihydroorotase
MNGLARAGCIAFSQAKRAIVDTQLLLRAMQYAATFGYAVRLRPQDQFLTGDGVAHDGEVASRLGLASIPVSAETVAIATALLLASQTGVRLHLSRLSSAAGITLIRQARRSNVQVTCDVSIHHLHLSEMDIGYFDSNARFDPPLRSASDRDALRAAAADGLAAICSDHTPVDADGKQLPFAEALPGATGLELLLPLTLLWAAQEKLPLALGTGPHHLRSGRHSRHRRRFAERRQSADVCVFDPDEAWRVTPEALRSQGKNTPFIGYEVNGRVRMTLVGGRIVFEG